MSNKPMDKPIRHLGSGFDVEPLMAQLLAHPDVWNEHCARTGPGPHEGVSDVWVRFNAIDNFDPANPAAFIGEHESVYYPVIKKLPAVLDLVDDISDLTGETDLMGILITKIPARGEVKPHQDHGWHADVSRKIAVQLRGNKDQAFCFEGSELRPVTGDVYDFVNQHTHWVTNESDEDRITLITCWRKS